MARSPGAGAAATGRDKSNRESRGSGRDIQKVAITVLDMNRKPALGGVDLKGREVSVRDGGPRKDLHSPIAGSEEVKAGTSRSGSVTGIAAMNLVTVAEAKDTALARRILKVNMKDTNPGSDPPVGAGVVRP
jgi:hypothetical protein